MWNHLTARQRLKNASDNATTRGCPPCREKHHGTVLITSITLTRIEKARTASFGLRVNHRRSHTRPLSFPREERTRTPKTIIKLHGSAQNLCAKTLQTQSRVSCAPGVSAGEAGIFNDATGANVAIIRLMAVRDTGHLDARAKPRTTPQHPRLKRREIIYFVKFFDTNAEEVEHGRSQAKRPNSTSGSTTPGIDDSPATSRVAALQKTQQTSTGPRIKLRRKLYASDTFVKHSRPPRAA
jgi:hypothetical protein